MRQIEKGWGKEGHIVIWGKREIDIQWVGRESGMRTDREESWEDREETK